MYEIINVREASELAGVSRITIRTWARDFNIGKKSGGRYVIAKKGLEMLMRGELFYLPRYLQKKENKKVNKTYEWS